MDKAGIDAHFAPFQFFSNAEPLNLLQSSSTFLSEAAESPQKCAEYCEILSDCNYFTHDNRLGNAEPICYFFETVPHPLTFYDAFADTRQEVPGYVSGWPAKTRHTEENANVVLSVSTITADMSSDYQAEYVVSLGANPTRGAVWVIPRLSSSIPEVKFIPEKIALYNNRSLARFVVSVLDPTALKQSYTVSIVHGVQSCDAAFEANTDEELTKLVLSINVPRKEGARASVVAGFVLLGVTLLTVVFVLVCWRVRRHRRIDTLWSVDVSDLHFGNPPEVVGRGTFGLVLLAEYRGTKVAVKRVIPPRIVMKKQKSSEETVDPEVEWMALVDDDFTDSVTGPDVVKLTGILDRRCLDRGDYQRLKTDFVSEMRELSKLRHPCITTIMGKPKVIRQLRRYRSLVSILFFSPWSSQVLWWPGQRNPC